MEDLAAITGFVRVMQAGSFAGAARRLGISASQLSKQISRLEQQLGTRLLRRTTRSLSLTEAGSIYSAHALRIVEELEASREAVTRLQSEPAGRLRVAALPSVCQSVIAPVLPALLLRYPGLDIELVASDRPVDLAEDGFDLAIRATRAPPPGVVARPLARIRYRLCASPDYLARAGTPASPEELSGHALLGYPRSLVTSAWRFHTSVENAPPLRQRVEVNQVGALLQMVRRHAGIALLPLYAVSDDLADGTLVEVLPGTLRMDEHGLYAIYLPNRYGSPKLRAFVDFLEAHMREHAAAWEQAAEET